MKKRHMNVQSFAGGLILLVVGATLFISLSAAFALFVTKVLSTIW